MTFDLLSSSSVRTTRPFSFNCCSILNLLALFVPRFTIRPAFRYCVMTRVRMNAGRVLTLGGGAAGGRFALGLGFALGFGFGLVVRRVGRFGGGRRVGFRFGGWRR